MERIWIKHYPPGVPADIDPSQYASVVALFEERGRSFNGLSAYSAWRFTLTGEPEPEELTGAQVSVGHFSVVGVKPALGRAFLPEDSERGQSDVAVLSHGLWQRRYGGDPEILGRRIELGGAGRTSFRVVGVMPPEYRSVGWGEPWQVWVPLEEPADLQTDDSWYLDVVGRLKPGVSVEQASAEARRLARRAKEEMYPRTSDDDVALARVEPGLYPSHDRLGWESWYFRAKSMTWVWLLYLPAVIVLLLALVYRWTFARRLGMGLFGLAFAFHTFAVGLRWYVSGRWPNSNMFEAVTTSAWFGCVAALALEWWARRSAMRNLFALGSAEMLPKTKLLMGKLSYREKIALSPDAVVKVQLWDATDPGNVELVDETTITRPGQVPVRFALHYRNWNADRRYELTARVVDGGQLRFATPEPIQVLQKEPGSLVAEFVISAVR